ncbi:glycoside hydrolase family 16 protein [Saccharicrinis carchari]|nr:glycoside hydrolase family 16 protein [Saccharicrinis carchari]
MANFFSGLFGNKFPSTDKYENENKQLRSDLERFKKLEKSDSVLRYFELDTLVHSGEFKQNVTKLKKERFRHTEAFHQYKKFKEYKRSSNVKRYNKYLRKGKNEEAEKLRNTSEIQTYLGLKNYIESPDFSAVKREMNDKQRFKKSQEYLLLEEFKALSKSDDVNWFIKTKKENPFTQIDKWRLTFEDDFDGTRLDESKWITGYYWGKALMNDNYVQANEKQFFKAQNIELRNSCATIISKSEKCTGKIWDKGLGFVPQEFEYTSGIMNTGQSFRQQFGRFEAKIKFSHATPAQHAFWLLSEHLTPQVNIFSSPEKGKNKIEAGNFWMGNGQPSKSTQTLKIPGSSKDFFIYGLEWSKDKMEWKINGVTVHTITQNVPQQPMYISLSTHFTNPPNKQKLPLFMDIDWVRCYQLN